MSTAPTLGAVKAAEAVAEEVKRLFARGDIARWDDLASIIDCLAVQPERERADKAEARVKELEAALQKIVSRRTRTGLRTIPGIATTTIEEPALSEREMMKVAAAALAKHGGA